MRRNLLKCYYSLECPDDFFSSGHFFLIERREGKLQASLGDRIKIIRKTNRLNQHEFSNLIGISQATLSELEQGKYNPSLETILSIHKVFKTNLSWLLIGDNNEDNETHNLFNTSLDDIELKLVDLFRSLKGYDKQEIIQFMKLKINRYLSEQ